MHYVVYRKEGNDLVLTCLNSCIHKHIVKHGARPNAKSYLRLLLRTLVVELWTETTAWLELGDRYHDLVYNVLNDVLSTNLRHR